MNARRPIAAAILLTILAVAGCQGGQSSLPPEQRLKPPQGPPADLPQTVPYTGPVSLIVITSAMLTSWGNQYPASAVTVRAMEGLVNRDAPRIFILQDGLELHDSDWLNTVVSERHGALVTQPDTATQISDLRWYIGHFRSSFAGYILFDAGHGSSERIFESVNVAISLAGVLNALPIDARDQGLLDAAKQAGLQQVADVRNDDLAWLRSSQYWPQLNRNAIYFDRLFAGDVEGADYAVALRMAAFQDDPRNDSGMQTMAEMLQDQRPGGIVFGWGYTDGNHGEDLFVEQASRYDQSVMDTPPNLSVYMHFPATSPFRNPPPPATIPTATGKHYVAFVYSDGDNPRVILDKLTQQGADRWASPLRGTIPVGWTVPPTMVGYAPVGLAKLYAEATPDDEFVAGPSGVGYDYPSSLYEKDVAAAEAQATMATLGLHSVLDLDVDGTAGFSHAALDRLMAQPAVRAVFFAAYNGNNQPSLGQVLWSSGKPALPMYVMFRRPGQPDEAVAGPTADLINSLSTDDSSPAAYTVVYMDFWSISMHDIADVISRLHSDVQVVRPDVLAELVNRNVAHG